MIWVVIGVGVVIVGVLGALFKYIEVLSGEFKVILVDTLTGKFDTLNKTLNAPEVRHHLTKNIDPKLVRERRQLFLKESRR